MSLPEKFVERLVGEMGEAEARALCEALEGEPPASIRLNPCKPTVEVEGERIPWSRYGVRLASRPSFTADTRFHAGAYYVQEAGSQFVGHLLEPYDMEGAVLLDMCAAPGGKTTLYSTLVGRDGLVVANEIVRNRAMVLADNVRKWGMGNVVVTNNDPRHLAAFGNFFDVVAVDAPCSGEGMFRKDAQAREVWSENAVRMCAARQSEILDRAWEALRPGGVLIYSTCTFNTVENEGVLRAFGERVGDDLVEAETAGCDPQWGVVEGREGVFRTFRFYPHRTCAEGFFAAVARKRESGARRSLPKARRRVMNDAGGDVRRELSRWVTEPDEMRFAEVAGTYYAYRARAYEEVRRLSESLSVVCSGVAMGQVFGGKLKPDPALAFFCGLNREAVPCTDLPQEEALKYLRKQELQAPLFAEGVNLVCCDGYALGFAKRVSNRVNNLYPNSLRILKTDL